MKHFNIPQIMGVVKDLHPRAIPDNKASDAINIMFKQGVIRNRWGYGQFGGQLNGAITGLTYYEKLRTGQNYIVAFTSTDTYCYNKHTGVWELITRAYSTGTATSTTSAVTLSTAMPSNLSTETNMYIKFGDTSLNSSGDWYKVDYSDSTTLGAASGVTLPEVGSASAFVLRICWSGDDTSYHSVAYPYYDQISDVMMMVVNGVDAPQFWTGDGTMQPVTRDGVYSGTYNSAGTTVTVASSVMPFLREGDAITGTGIPANTTISDITSLTTFTLSQATTDAGTSFTISGTSPNPAKYIAFFGSVGYEHTLLSSTVDGAYENIQTIEYSDAADPFKWSGNYDEFLDSNDEILGMIPLETRIVVYKRYNLSMMAPSLNPSATDFFDIEENYKRNVGTTSIRTVRNLVNFHVFMGWEDIYIFDGINVTRIGNDIIKHLISTMNRDAMVNSFAIDIDEESLYCLFVPIGDGIEHPNYCFCFNYQEKHWTIWQLKDRMTAQGFFVKDFSPTYNDLIVFTTGTFTNGNTTIPVASTAGLQVGMSVFEYTDGSPLTYVGGLPTPDTNTTIVSKIVSIGSGNIVVSIAPSASRAAYLKIGWAYEDLNQRYKDMIVKSNFNTYLLGDKDGFVYEFSEDFTADRQDGKVWDTAYPDDSAYDVEDYDFGDGFTETDAQKYAGESNIKCMLQTAYYEMEDTKNTKRICESTLGYIRQDDGYFKIRCSTDFGNSWSPWQLIPMDTQGINGGADYVEYINNWSRRGTQVTFQITNRDGTRYYNPFQIESLMIGFNDMTGVRR